MSNLEHNEKQLRIITSFMNDTIRELAYLETVSKSNKDEIIGIYERLLADLCDVVRPLERKIHLAKLDIAIEEGDFKQVDVEREAIELWKEKER